MLVIEQNYGKRYEYTVSALEASIGLDAGIVCIQEPFLGNRDISHSGFNLYWPAGTDNQKDMRVLVAVKKDILNRVIMENWTNLISHPYCQILDIRELYLQSGRYLRKTRIVNLYDNKVRKDQPWQGPSASISRAIQDIPCVAGHCQFTVWLRLPFWKTLERLYL